MAYIPGQKPYRGGDNLGARITSARDLNRPIEAVEALAKHVQNNLPLDVPPAGLALADVWIAEIVKPPTDGDTPAIDFPGSYYWAKRKKLITDYTAPDYTPLIDQDEDESGKAMTVPALNLADWVNDSKRVQIGRMVMILGFDGRDGTGRRQYVFNSDDDGFVGWGRITGSTEITGKHNVYSYTVVEQEAGVAGQMKDKSGGWSLVAYNSVEQDNSDTGLQGNGVNLNDYPAGTKVLPLNGRHRIYSLPICDPDTGDAIGTQYWMEGNNLMGVVCA